MKWFQHHTDAHRNRKIRRVLRVHGITGYGIWFALLEKIYEVEDNFQIRADELWLENFADDLKISDPRTLIRVFDTFSEVGLISSQLWAEHSIYCESIIEQGDDYIQKKALNAQRQARFREKSKAESEDESRVSNALRNAESNDVTLSEAEANSNSEIRDQIQKEDSDRERDRAQNDGKIEKAGKGIDDLSEKDFLALVLDAYNECKPALWVYHHSMNLQRVKAVKNAMKEIPDRASFLRLIRDSLSHVKSDPDPWWSSKRKTFITLFEKGRIFDWADLWQDAQNNPEKFEVAARFQDPKQSKEIMAAINRQRSYEQARLEIEQEQMNKQNPEIEVSHVEF